MTTTFNLQGAPVTPDEFDASLVLHRLNSIDKTLMNVSQSLERLVLVEERQAQTNASLERAFGVLEKMDVRLGVVEKANVLNNRASGWVERGLLAAAGALFAMFIHSLFTKGGL
jgi:hypothetical protein